MSAVYVAETHSDGWYASRREGITASEIATVLGISPASWASPFNLYHRKKSGIGEERDNDSMRWGRRLEAAILEEFECRHPELYIERGGLFRHDERVWQRATPDAVVKENVGTDVDLREPVAVVEAKTSGTGDEWGETGTDEVPVHYRAQVQWQMDVMGVGVAYMPVLFNGRTYREYVVTYSPEDCALMRTEAEDFLRRLREDDPPPIDWTPATTRTLKALYQQCEGEAQIPADLASQYRAAKAALSAAKQRDGQVTNELRAAMGTAKYALCGDMKVASRSVYQLAEKVITRKASIVDKITPAGGNK